MPRVVIVGAGISGLALAYRLEQQSHEIDVVVLEAQDRPGGTIRTIRRDGFQIEAGPNGFLDTRPGTFVLCSDAGLRDQLVAADPLAARNRYLFIDGRLKRLPAGLFDFVRSDLVSWHGKASLVAERFFRPRRGRSDESIMAFARRHAGPEIARVFADALVTGIFAGDPDVLSMNACFPRLVEYERTHGSVLKGLAKTARERRARVADKRPATLWSLRRGLGQLIDTLSERLRSRPLLGVPIRSIHRQDSRWVIQSAGNDVWTADAVALACPAYQQAAILYDLDTDLANQIGAIPYNRIAVVALGYRREDVPHALAGFGYLVPRDHVVLGAQWCSSTYPGRSPPGRVLLRAMVGGWRHPEAVGWQDERLLDLIRSDFAQTMGIQAAPIFHHIVRWNRAIPQYLIGHTERVSSIAARAARHAGLFLTGNAYYGVALNDCAEQAEVLANRIQTWLLANARSLRL
jgi:protoporphyrinogen/coproporphyrinogen III oxidase